MDVCVCVCVCACVRACVCVCVCMYFTSQRMCYNLCSVYFHSSFSFCSSSNSSALYSSSSSIFFLCLMLVSLSLLLPLSVQSFLSPLSPLSAFLFFLIFSLLITNSPCSFPDSLHLTCCFFVAPSLSSFTSSIV